MASPTRQPRRPASPRVASRRGGVSEREAWLVEHRRASISAGQRIAAIGVLLASVCAAIGWVVRPLFL